MKKLSQILTYLTTAALFSLTAYGQTPENETASLCQELQSKLPSSGSGISIDKIYPNYDNLGINLEMSLISSQLAAKNIGPMQLNDTLATIFQAHFCRGKSFYPQLNKFTSNGHYINVLLQDSTQQALAKIMIGSNFCSNNNLSDNSLDLSLKQMQQGYYDENYLSNIYIPSIKKLFPITYNDELHMVNVKAGPGSQLHYLLVYNPRVAVASSEAANWGSYVLDKIVNSVCEDSNFNVLSRNVDLITYHFTYNGTEVATRSVKKGCRLY